MVSDLQSSREDEFMISVFAYSFIFGFWFGYPTLYEAQKACSDWTAKGYTIQKKKMNKPKKYVPVIVKKGIKKDKINTLPLDTDLQGGMTDADRIYAEGFQASAEQMQGLNQYINEKTWRDNKLKSRKCTHEKETQKFIGFELFFPEGKKSSYLHENNYEWIVKKRFKY